MRSLTLLKGLKDSSLAATVARAPWVTWLSCTSGVPPMVPVIEAAMFMPWFLLRAVLARRRTPTPLECGSALPL